tara:strand:- start:452 stop:1366 length:915 start_codon:yes stop_codon:yes gene_type:complete
MKNKLMIIGSSKIVEEHIKCAIKVGFKLYSLNSSKIKSKNEYKINKKYKFEKRFKDWREAIKNALNDKTIIILLAPKFSKNLEILNFALKGENLILIEKPVSTNLTQLKSLKKKYENRIFVLYNRIFYRNIQYLKRNISNVKNVIIKFTDDNKKNILQNSIHIISVMNYLFGEVKIKYSKKEKDTINMVVINKIGIPIFLIYNNKYPETYSIDIRTKNIRYLLKPLEKLQIIKKINLKYKNNNKKMLIPYEKIEKTIDLYKSNTLKPGFFEQMMHVKKKLKNHKKFGNFDLALQAMKFAREFIK